MRVADADAITALAKAWAAVGPTPCEHYACRHRQRCAAERLACDAFRLYVARGRTVNPLAVVKDTRQRGMQVVDLAHAVQPTAQTYALVFPRKDAPSRREPVEFDLSQLEATE